MTDGDHVSLTRAYWDAQATRWVEMGEAAWRQAEPSWGIWELPETQLQMLPADMRGMHAIELGCGTGYVSAWMARRGASVVGIDNSEQQLATARRLASEHGVAVTLLHGNADRVPYPDGSFDFAITEYGAAIWCDPRLWLPEARRLLKPGGQLVFLGNTPLAMLCMPDNGDSTTTTLQRSYFDLHRLDWSRAVVDPGGVEFNLPISGWLRLFRETGFELLDYLELQAPPGAPDRFYTRGEWGRHWPAEHVWKLRRS